MPFLNHTALSQAEQLAAIVEKAVCCGRKILKQHPNIPYPKFAKQLESQNIFSWDSSIESVIHELMSLTGDQMLREYCTQLHQNRVEPFTFTQPSPPHIAIIGAGLAGLLAGTLCARFGIKVDIFESRSNKSSRVRPQNISFKEAELRLKPLLGEKIYKTFFDYGGALDGSTGKLRITTGSFQDILTKNLEDCSANIHYDHPFTSDDIEKLSGFDAILIATGVHACKRLGLSDYFNPIVFDEYITHGRTALCAAPTEQPHGYYRREREGYHWRRDNISIFSGNAFTPDLARLIHRFEEKKIHPQQIPRLASLMKEKTTEYTFIFGNDTDEFLRNLPRSTNNYLIEETRFTVEPMISLTPVSQINQIPLIAIGDANGSPHPLAAIGTLKFLRNMTHLVSTISAIHYTTSQVDSDKLCKKLLKIYHETAMKNNREVFFANILCSIFSEERNAATIF